MNYEGNASYLYVANVARGTNTIAGMAAGSVAIVGEDGTVATGAKTTGNYRVAQKLASGQVIYSDFFNMATRQNVNGTSYSAPVQQVSYLGYNGTSGALDATAAADFVVNMEWLNTSGIYNNSPLMLSGAYRTVAASQKELANGLQASLNGALERQPYKFVTVDVVGDGTVAAITGTSTITKLTKNTKGVGSYIKTADATAAFTASTSTVTDATVLNVPSSGGRTFSYTQTLLGTGAGSAATYIGETAYLIADQGTAAQNATAMAAAINAGSQATAVAATALVTITYNTDFYSLPPLAMETADDSTWTNVVVTTLTGDAIPTKHVIDGTTSAAASFVLSEAYTGETGYVFDGTTAAGMTGIATVTNYGLKFSGHESSSFDAQVDTPTVTRFAITSGDFSTAVVTNVIKPSKGNGYYKEVASLEAYSQFLDKSPFISAYPRNNQRSEVSSLKNYDFVTFDVVEVVNTSVATGLSTSKKNRIQIAMSDLLAGDDVDTVFGVTV